MEPMYERSFSVTAGDTDRHGRLKASRILWMLQEVAGDHSTLLGTAFRGSAQRGSQQTNIFDQEIAHITYPAPASVRQRPCPYLRCKAG